LIQSWIFFKAGQTQRTQTKYEPDKPDNLDDPAQLQYCHRCKHILKRLMGKEGWGPVVYFGLKKEPFRPVVENHIKMWGI